MNLGGPSSPEGSSESPSDRPATAAPLRADWYPDPTGRFEHRYHNGLDWTGDVAVDGNRYIDRLPRLAAGDPFARPLLDARSLDPAALTPQSRPASAAKATAALVLGIASVVVGWVPFVFVLAVASAVLALAFGVPTMRRAGRENPVNRKARNFALTGVILAPIGLALCGVGVWLSVLTYREVDRFTDVGGYSIDTASCAVDGGVAMFSGTITNLSSETRSYHITVSFQRRGTDNTLYNASSDVDDVRTGEAAAWSVNEVVREDELDCAIDSVSGPLPFDAGS